jgi:hypothetical protein
MTDDEIDEDREHFPPDDPTSALEQLDAGFEDAGPGGEPPAPLDRLQIDELIDQVISEELERLEQRKARDRSGRSGDAGRR